jgi:hypothetical protein
MNNLIEIMPIQVEQVQSRDEQSIEFVVSSGWRWKSIAHKQRAMEWIKKHVTAIETSQGTIYIVAGDS